MKPFVSIDKDQNYYFEEYGKLLVPDGLRIGSIPPKLDEDGRLTAKTTRINEPNNATAIAHRPGAPPTPLFRIHGRTRLRTLTLKHQHACAH